MTSRTWHGVPLLVLGMAVAPVAWAQEPYDEPAQPPAAPPAAGPTPEEPPAAAPAPPTPAPPPVTAAPAPPPPPAPAPPGFAPAGPATMVVSPPPPPPAPGPDAAGPAPAEPKKAIPARVPWRGTALDWGHTVTTTALGVGMDALSDSQEYYIMSWGLTLNYYLVDQESWSLQARAFPGFSVELTNSDTTTTEREPQFGDLPVALVYGRKIFAPESIPGLSTIGSAQIRVTFPTSPTSYSIGTYLVTSPRLSLTQTIPLFGESSPVLPSVELGGGLRWDHRFGAATTAVNGGLNRTRQTARGESFLSDQLSFSPLTTDTLREGFYFSFPQDILGTELTLGVSFAFTQMFKPTFEGSDCEVQILTGCVKAQSPEDKRTTVHGTGFGASIDYYPIPDVGVSLGYANGTPSPTLQLGPDGQRRNIFYSPDAEFTADILVSIDAIYERITGPPRDSSFVLTASQQKKRRAPQAAPVAPLAL
ncbi:MAG: hypothetical protein HY744_03430 [Deltaproteobacteria bacterium]|nr:hypothetical protein [Deltaproteobacteria bacterium]